MHIVAIPSVGCESYHHCSWPQKEWMFTAAGRLVLVPGDGEDRGRTSGLVEGLGCQHRATGIISPTLTSIMQTCNKCLMMFVAEKEEYM